MKGDDGIFRHPPSLIPSTTKYTMPNSVVVLLVYLIPSANIRVLLLIVIIDYFVFSTSPATFFGVKEGARDREVFLPHPSSPARRGSTSLLNPPILRREDLKPGRPGLYSQTSSRPKGLLVIAYAIELRLFVRRGRPCGTDNMRMTLGAWASFQRPLRSHTNL